MRYEPYADEYAAVPNMTDEELLEYFLFRIAETDEVWSLKDGPRWLTREINGQETQPVWPFKRFAQEAAVGDWQNLRPVPESLEFFIYQILNQLAIRNVTIEIMPRASGPGCLINPRQLASYLEGMRDSSECMLGD
ncbi:DUF2750 domain-containing protein [Methylomonas paludis]|uniref:DUF2750 domain-containing protein n=1 Tax=Methylomonas paludis TaxID=1173101 RepID=A0A975MME4_9GAMM|nr:DUF2750 domain-containing protein [Methylomonas paludis]QWF70558.1 DUF2750 domain-containing protein [Methylomonas paludis]